MLEIEQCEELLKPIPDWATKPHPVKQNLTVIHPMAVVERLNSVFGFGGWQYAVEYISCEKEMQVTKNGSRPVYVSSVKGVFDIPQYDIHLEQFGGSTNDDRGDALKGGATDALTKIASYIGIGYDIYTGKHQALQPSKPLR